MNFGNYTSNRHFKTLNICSFVHQCNTFTILLIVDMFRPHTAIFKCYSILSRSWCSVMPIFLPMPGCQPSSSVIVYSPEAGALLCQFFCLCQGASHVLAIFKCYSILSRSWCSVMPIFAYVIVPVMCFS
jgi:hypothetical protein